MLTYDLLPLSPTEEAKLAITLVWLRSKSRKAAAVSVDRSDVVRSLRIKFPIEGNKSHRF